jgi:hypothetical protein
LVWWDGGSGCCPLLVSYAPQSGLALARKKPRAAATAILRIGGARRGLFAQPLSVRRIGETEDVIRDIVPTHRVAI